MNAITTPTLPVAIIGAGPVGLAAAAHVHARGLTPVVFEAGDGPGAAVRSWSHVRMFSPWRFNIDRASEALLERHGWRRPDDEAFPTGGDLVERYLSPLASVPELATAIRYTTRVEGVARRHHDRMKDGTRASAPLVVRVRDGRGERDVLARAVIDASGTINRPGWLGASGIPAAGEREASDRIFYGIPDVLDQMRRRYEGRHTLVVGSGHSALNALLDLASLAEAAPGTRVTWAVRRPVLGQTLGGRRADQLAERGRLGARVRELLDAGRVSLVTGFHIDRVACAGQQASVMDGARILGPFDEIVAATGFRPDWSILSELRLDLDPAVECPRALAPLIDPNVHSCGSVPPHGAEELSHPDADAFAVGMKSYGRAPTFLLLTGYEQVRSVVSAIAGDWESARRVELVLPATGACRLDEVPSAAKCCR